MNKWIKDAVEQIGIGEILANSNLSCGERLGLIAVDNAIEYLLISYVEVYKKIVGGHITGGISKKDWEQKKRYFSDMLSFIISKETTLQCFEDDINRYHDLRSDIYHSGKLVTVSKETVNSYVQIAKNVLKVLFNESVNENEWKELILSIKESITDLHPKKNSSRGINFEKVDDNIRISTDAKLYAKDAILLVIYGHQITFGEPPNRDQIKRALLLSGKSIQNNVFNSRLSDLRKGNLLRRNIFLLTTKGEKLLNERYLFS